MFRMRKRHEEQVCGGIEPLQIRLRNMPAQFSPVLDTGTVPRDLFRRPADGDQPELPLFAAKMRDSHNRLIKTLRHAHGEKLPGIETDEFAIRNAERAPCRNAIRRACKQRWIEIGRASCRE